MQSKQKLRCGVFIDGANLMWGSLKMDVAKRWFIDFSKLRTYLQGQYQPLFIRYYDAVDSKPRTARFKARAKAEARLYSKLRKLGYEVITKPLKYIRQSDGSFTTKGDMDIELAMGMMESMDDLDMIILISGDSDYLAPIKLLHGKGKAIRILSFRSSLAWELRSFAIQNRRCSYKTIESMRSHIEFGKN